MFFIEFGDMVIQASMGFLAGAHPAKCSQACLAIILKTVLHAYDSFLVALQKLGVLSEILKAMRNCMPSISFFGRGHYQHQSAVRDISPDAWNRSGRYGPLNIGTYWHAKVLRTTIPCMPLNYEYSHWAFDSLSQYEVIFNGHATDSFGQTSIPKITCSRRGIETQNLAQKNEVGFRL